MARLCAESHLQRKCIVGVIGPYGAVAASGSVVIILLGYAYVGFPALPRPHLGSQLKGRGRA